MNEAPRDANDTAPVDRFCDIVMKGGITSGVVYPLAICELARSYRFKNIGGTSVGAIAAALTAAAEYQRRKTGSLKGFKEVLGPLPTELGQDVNGKSKLLSLFQTSSTTRRLFAILLSTLNRKTPGRSIGSAVLRAPLVYWESALAGASGGALFVLLLAHVAVPASLFGVILFLLLAVLLSILGALLATGLAVYHDIVHGLVENKFGLCTGGETSDSTDANQALIPWLHERIQTAAGPDGEMDHPLTFGDLWNAGGFPPSWAQSGKKGRHIDLRMITTSVTHGRPFHLPIEDTTSRLFFKRKDLEPYFPKDVLDYLENHSEKYVPHSGSDPAPSAVESDILELPSEHMPIVVAARLSMSFPLLFSAVPLWAIDYSLPLGKRELRKCWFSDGGISSNFPIHLFDAFLPMWPTFGITLEPVKPAYPDQRTWLPRFGGSGRGDSWANFEDKKKDKKKPVDALSGFLTAIANAAMEWNDNALQRMPAVRDRVVRIRLKDNEGGLNLNMPPKLINDLAGYGLEAGEKLREAFAPGDTDSTPTCSWRKHRLERFKVLTASLRDQIKDFTASAKLNNQATPLRAEIEAAIGKKRRDGLSTQQAEALTTLLDALENLESAFAGNSQNMPVDPQPEPVLRVRPPL